MTSAPPRMLEDLAQRLLASPALGPALRREHSLAPYTSYRVGGPARLFVTVNSELDLRELAESLADARGPRPPLLVVGRGSNLLVADRGFDGLAVRLGSGLAHIEVNGSSVIAGGAALLPVIARASAELDLGGFEWAVGVPGTLGGAVRMNAGAHDTDMAACLATATVVDLRGGRTRQETPTGLRLGYRSSDIAAHEVVASATLQLSPRESGCAMNEVTRIVKWRRAHQPGGRNTGSVFTNPDGMTAGWLIDAAGAKGLRIASAHVSSKHANFIQSDEGGRAADIVALMREVRRRVHDRHGVELAVETRLVGFEQQELP